MQEKFTRRLSLVAPPPPPPLSLALCVLIRYVCVCVCVFHLRFAFMHVLSVLGKLCYRLRTYRASVVCYRLRARWKHQTKKGYTNGDSPPAAHSFEAWLTRQAAPPHLQVTPRPAPALALAHS